MKKEIILQILSTDRFVSGEYLSRQLNISRTAVWKHIKSLQENGYKFESKPHVGYRLIKRPEEPLAEEIIPRLKTKIIGKEILHFKAIDSTNSYAKKIIVKNNPIEGTVIISEIQTKGKGRKNREWSSSKGGLWFSIILFPPLSPQRAMYVTMAASIALVQAIFDICKIKAEIKWPNDILIQGKKVCGVLTEIDAEMDLIHYSIIGIGMNVNNILSDELTEKATTLQTEKNTIINRKDLLCSIFTHFDALYHHIKQQELSLIKEKWISSSNMIGKEVKVHGEKETIRGTVNGIDDQGCLLVQEKDGVIRVITGDIVYI
jgi:BirA family transcriptional regulator, biotin operon repressor / biotin---[acetyl-CoA-carboxylase] ligase